MELEIDFGNDGLRVTASLSKDGNQWCVLLGPDLQVGIAGFGNSTWEAIAQFRHNFRNA